MGLVHDAWGQVVLLSNAGFMDWSFIFAFYSWSIERSQIVSVMPLKRPAAFFLVRGTE
jgi:hypothetical protein